MRYLTASDIGADKAVYIRDILLPVIQGPAPGIEEDFNPYQNRLSGSLETPSEWTYPYNWPSYINIIRFRKIINSIDQCLNYMSDLPDTDIENKIYTLALPLLRGELHTSADGLPSSSVNYQWFDGDKFNLYNRIFRDPGRNLDQIFEEYYNTILYLIELASNEEDQLASVNMNVFADYVQDHICDYSSCSNCGDFFSFDNGGGYAYNEDAICESCCDTDYTWNDTEDTYVANGDTDTYQDSSYEGIYSYDADPLHYLPNKLCTKNQENLPPSGAPLLGVELEVEKKRDAPYNAPAKTAEEVKNWAILKSDGSLCDGFEIVTAPATMEYHFSGKNGVSPWEEFFEGSSRYYKSFTTDTCGVHVHVDRKALTPLQIGKIIQFMNYRPNYDEIMKIAGRGVTTYCELQTPHLYKFALQGDLGHQERTKYSWVNVGKSETIEFRLFKGNLKKVGLFRYIEFTQACIEFCKEMSFRHLLFHNFCRWMSEPSNRARFKHLYAFMKERWHSVSYTNKKIPPCRLDERFSVKNIQKEVQSSSGGTNNRHAHRHVRLTPDSWRNTSTSILHFNESRIVPEGDNV